MPGDSCTGWVCCVMSCTFPKCLRMATVQKLTKQHITELILESDTDAHSSEDKDISPQSDTNTDSDTEDITDTNCMQWTDNTHCRLSVFIVHRITWGFS
jgi:hypothetical protein